MTPLPTPPWQPVQVPELDAPVITWMTEQGLAPQYSQGLEPEGRPSLPGYDSGVMSLLIATFLIVAVNFRHYTAFLRSMAQELFSGRRTRPNVFDDPTVSETRIVASLVIVLAVSQAIILCSLPGMNPQGGVGRLLLWGAGAVGFYVVQLIVYSSLGFAFSSQEASRQWMKAFNGAESLLAMALVVPALVVLFNPGTAGAVWGIALTLYLAARILFVVKGFRLFYRNLFSIPGFILYLCALEIAPLAAIARCAGI